MPQTRCRPVDDPSLPGTARIPCPFPAAAAAAPLRSTKTHTSCVLPLIAPRAVLLLRQDIAIEITLAEVQKLVSNCCPVLFGTTQSNADARSTRRESSSSWASRTTRAGRLRTSTMSASR